MTDITITEINTRLSALVVAMLAKGGAQPKAELTFKADSSPAAYLWCSTEQRALNGHYLKTFSGGDAGTALILAEAFIGELQDRKEIALRDHMRRVADCIDKGREDCIDDAYIAPLVVVKQAMAENLLTSQVSA